MGNYLNLYYGDFTTYCKMETPQIESITIEKEIKGFRRLLRKFKAAVLPIPSGKSKVTNKKRSVSVTIPNSNQNGMMAKDEQIVKVTAIEEPIENSSAKKNIIVGDQDKSSATNGSPFLEPMKAFPLLNSHDIIIPLNTDSFTCPQCHTPHSVHYVKEDTEQGQSKEIYICLSHGNHGCGWEGTKEPNEDDIHAHITATLGFRPLRLN
ncbi:7695_t:CDS:2 [Acaulospora colombiana]|uniref:7695_t:CDS:1 n=1 Tax=Acaulospora colombiana TaxID=27376 RepID=A0ACA9KWU6_9GLOM|nr:7695_t:CDS:2 [Acaulospora colombiana]